MRWISRLALGIGALVVIAAAAVVLNADRLIKSAVERNGTHSLRLATSLDSARLSLFGGKLGLNGLAIASPAGFTAPHFLEAHAIDVDASFAQLRREPIHVGSLTIDRPVLVIEQSGGALNFRKAMERMAPAPPGQEPMKLIIDTLRISD